MKRILSSWPYALGTVGLFGLLWASSLFSMSCADPSAGCRGISTLDWKSIDLAEHFLGFPALAFLGAALLGFRRGYDWVTLLVCLALGMAIPEPAFDESFRVAATWIHKDWFFLGLYVVVVHLGIAAGMVVRTVVRRAVRGRVAVA